jgi:hypothetical protein
VGGRRARGRARGSARPEPPARRCEDRRRRGTRSTAS